MKAKKVARCISVWRYYFLNRRVANLLGFFIITLFAVLLVGAYAAKALDPRAYTTILALSVSAVAYIYLTRVLASQKPRDYWVCVRENARR